MLAPRRKIDSQISLCAYLQRMMRCQYSDSTGGEMLFEDRLNQVDIRFSRVFRINRARVQRIVDVYNVFNGSSVLTYIPRYGSA